MENWLPVAGWPGYFISDQGNVQGSRGRLLKPCLSRTRPGGVSYLKVTLKVNGKQITPRIHELVLWHFVGPKPNGLEARHRNGNNLDNRLENLCWGTSLENNLDRIEHGTMPYGEAHGRAKLTEEQVAYIRAQPHGSAQLARELGVSYQTIKGIRRGKVWKRQLLS